MEFNILFYFCYSGLNFQDLMVRQGAIDSPPKTPFILGFECAGEIEQVGEGVENFKVNNNSMLFISSYPNPTDSFCV